MTRRIKELWLETDEYHHTEGVADDYINIRVTMEDGAIYALNVWTFDYFDRVRGRVNEADGAPAYLVPPDLLVSACTRDCVEASIERLMVEEGIPDQCRIRDQRSEV